MYAVKVRESIMIAHSLDDPAFGAAQNLHGATYTVDVEFFAAELDRLNVVIDIARAREVVATVLGTLDYRNLDDLEELAGQLTTAEFVARHIHDRVAASCRSFFAGGIRVAIRECHDAWVSYDGRQAAAGE